MCYAFSPQFAKLATLRFSLILPAVLSIVYIGAFEATRQWGDLYTLLMFGLLGWFMKQAKWPRPPLVLGLVLGDTIERYMFISVERYGITWFARPVVAILFIIAILGLMRPLLDDVKRHGGVVRLLTDFGRPIFHPSQLMAVVLLFVIGSAMLMALQWDFSAKIVPLVVGTVAFTAAATSLFNDMFRRDQAPAGDLAEQIEREVEQTMRAADAAAAAGTGPGVPAMAMAAATPGSGTVTPRTTAVVPDAKAAQARIQQDAARLHMDLESDTKHLSVRTIALRAGRFFSYLVGFMGVMSVIGLVPTAGLFVIFFMRYENQESWKIVIPYAIFLMFAISFVFDYIMSVPWPPTLVAGWFPILKMLPSI
jgi:hypothetical protein